MNVKERVFNIFSETLGIPRESINEQTVIVDVVPDSITYFELFLELEKELNKKLSFELVINIKTLGDIVSFIEITEQEKYALR